MLVVDDEPSILFAISEYFSARGWEVDGVQDAETAKALLTQKRYSVVVADLRLTEADDVAGLDVVTTARHRAPDTRILLLTAYGSQAIEAAARRRGADAVLYKPMPLAELARVITGFLAGGPPAPGTGDQSECATNKCPD
jgi:two-component system response regulator FlrC